MPASVWKNEEEKSVRERIAELAKQSIVNHKSEEGDLFLRGEPTDIKCSMELGLRSLLLFDRFGGVLDEGERERLANRANVLLRKHPPAGVNLQIDPKIQEQLV